MRNVILSIVEHKVGDRYKIVGDHIYLNCPYAAKRHESKSDSTPSFCVELTNCRFYCHSCSLKGSGLHHFKKIYKVKNQYVPKSGQTSFNRDKLDFTKRQDVIFPTYRSSIFTPDGRRGLEYIINKRNPTYSKEDVFKLIERFDLQFCHKATKEEYDNFRPYVDYLIIPFSCNGFKSFTARSTNGREPRHNHPKGSNVGSLLYGYDDVESNTAILVEGPFDRFRLYTYGFENVMGTFGKCVSSEQKSLLLGKRPKLENLILMFDWDGIPEAKKLAKELSLFFRVSVCELPEGKQPDTISKQIATDLIMKALDEINFKKARRQ